MSNFRDFNFNLDQYIKNIKEESFKEQIINWIYNLNERDYFFITTIINKYFTYIMIKMLMIFREGNNNIFKIKENYIKNYLGNFNHKEEDLIIPSYKTRYVSIFSLDDLPEKIIFKKLKVLNCNDLYDSISLDRGFLLERKKLIEYLEIISMGKLFNYNYDKIKNINTKFDLNKLIPNWFDYNNFNYIAQWFTSHLEMNMVYYYLNQNKIENKQLPCDNKTTIIKNYMLIKDYDSILKKIMSEFEVIVDKIIKKEKKFSEKQNIQKLIIHKFLLDNDYQNKINNLKEEFFQIKNNINENKSFCFLCYLTYNSDLFKWETLIFSLIGLNLDEFSIKENKKIKNKKNKDKKKKKNNKEILFLEENDRKINILEENNKKESFLEEKNNRKTSILEEIKNKKISIIEENIKKKKSFLDKKNDDKISFLEKNNKNKLNKSNITRENIDNYKKDKFSNLNLIFDQNNNENKIKNKERKRNRNKNKKINPNKIKENNELIEKNKNLLNEINELNNKIEYISYKKNDINSDINNFFFNSFEEDKSKNNTSDQNSIENFKKDRKNNKKKRRNKRNKANFNKIIKNHKNSHKNNNNDKIIYIKKENKKEKNNNSISKINEDKNEKKISNEKKENNLLISKIKNEKNSLFIKWSKKDTKEIVIKNNNFFVENWKPVNNFEIEFERCIKNLISKIMNFNEKLKFYRKNLIDLLNQFIKNIFPNLKINLEPFGSYKTGILTPFSDIDLSLQIKSIESINIKYILDKIYLKLMNKEFIYDIQNIYTATIPLIKLKIDLNKIFKNENFLEEERYIKIDIIVQKILEDNVLSNQLSTKFIMDYIYRNKNFFEIILFLKFIFSYNNLNNSYLGGLNSYGLSLMLISYLESNPKSNKLNTFLIENFLEFFSVNFDNKNIGIFINKDFDKNINSFIDISHFNNKNELNIYDPNYSNYINITRTCFNFDKIKKIMYFWYYKIKEFKNKKNFNFKNINLINYIFLTNFN